MTGAGDDLTAALARLAGDPARVVELGDPWSGPEDGARGRRVETERRRSRRTRSPRPEDDDAPPMLPDPRPALARGLDSVADQLHRRHRRRAADAERRATSTTSCRAEPVGPLPLVASATPSPLRDPVAAALRGRGARFEGAAALSSTRRRGRPDTELPEGRELRRPGSVNLIEETAVWADGVRPIARRRQRRRAAGHRRLRGRAGRGPGRRARARRRPHPARAHRRPARRAHPDPAARDRVDRGRRLRALRRRLLRPRPPAHARPGARHRRRRRCSRRTTSATPTPRSTRAGSSRPSSPPAPTAPIRGTRGGPNWSVLIAAVMALVLAWSIARLIMDSPVELRGAAPILNGSAGVGHTARSPRRAVPVVLNAAGGGAHVVVRDGAGDGRLQRRPRVRRDTKTDQGRRRRCGCSPPTALCR